MATSSWQEVVVVDMIATGSQTDEPGLPVQAGAVAHICGQEVAMFRKGN